MPELPEVETICQGIRPRLLGRRISGVTTSGKAMRHLPGPRELQSLKEAAIHEVRRRAKYIVIDLDRGLHLVLHLGMTGNLGFFVKDCPLKRHDHLCFLLDNGMELRLNDTRRFGGAWISDHQGLADLFAGLGPEPLDDDFSARYMAAIAAGRKAAVKNLLMDNRVVVGIGNIYACEALHAAGIHPARRAGEISAGEWAALVAAAKEVLAAGIKNGGTTISDYRNSDGMPGYFQNRLMVYGQKECRKCGGKISRIVLGGRASFFCPVCQPGP